MFNVEKAIEGMKNKKIVFWGAGRRLPEFIKSFCIDRQIVPLPDYICDSTKNLQEAKICGVAVLPFEELKKMDYSDVVIIITAGLFDLLAQIVVNEFYYFPVYHCRSFEAYYFLKENNEKFDKVLSLLADDDSKSLYRSLFNDLINGSLWDQSLFEPNAYFGNNLIGQLNEDGAFVLAGAFNGKHIDRALKNNPKAKVIAFEPNNEWYNYLVSKFRGGVIEVHKNALWDSKTHLSFDGDTLDHGLNAQVRKDNQGDNFISTITLDEVITDKVNLIALDVEGSEAHALKGGINTIKKYHPNLAICLYHRLGDFVNLPLLIDEISGGTYKFYVKQHSCITAIETVLYAIN